MTHTTSTYIGAAFGCVLWALGVTSVQAATINVNLTFDLNNSNIGGGTRDFLMGWSTPYVSFPEVHPVAGDSLRITINFVDHSNNRPQRLKVSDLGIGEPFEMVYGNAQGDPSLSLNANTNNSFTFHDVIGDILLNPVSGSYINGGSGIGANPIQNITDAAFSFTGITWQVDFEQLTYYSGDGFNLAAFGLQGDKIEVIQAQAAPDCSAATPFPAVLWSPNHQFVPIVIMGVTDPDGDSVKITVTSVTQDEPVQGPGSGNTSPDAVIQNGSAAVRAERNGNGNGRVYQVFFKAESNGGSCTSSVTVSVPHSMRAGLTVIDNGLRYDSTAP